MRPLRVGVVSYLNMLPLVAGLDELELEREGGRERLEVVPVPPGPMFDRMSAGELDLGMVPVGGLFRKPEWRVVGRSMIGSRGAVRSVLLAGRGKPAQWRRLHPDSHSRTSNLLAQVVLRRVFRADPEVAEVIPLEGWEPPAEAHEGEAWVLIGTRALRWGGELERRGLTVLDLGETWNDWTGLPFVYAVWAAREGVAAERWMEAFEALKARNLKRLDQLIAAWPGLEEERLTPAEARDYLTRNIRFDLDEEAVAGLQRFYSEAAGLGLVEPFWQLRR